MHKLRSSKSVTANPGSPFDLDNDPAFDLWCDAKLDKYPHSITDLMIEVGDPNGLTNAERDGIIRHCAKTNLALYTYGSGKVACKKTLGNFAEQLGLKNLDGNLCADDDRISSIRMMSTGRQRGYIPYTNLPLGWHSDGYYNPPKQRVCAFILHCVQSADNGGDNAFFDPEILYILLRRENPQYISALMAPEAMTIPANIENGITIRKAETGPVFSIDHSNNTLHMRYTDRKRHIEWKQDQLTTSAVKFIQKVLSDGSNYIFSHHLSTGQGLICNNVLHKRLGFTNSETNGHERLLYRARYYQRVAAK
ncbi:TauD/TfdA family dioxygenase [Pseudomonadota bacterium]